MLSPDYSKTFLDNHKNKFAQIDLYKDKNDYIFVWIQNEINIFSLPTEAEYMLFMNIFYLILNE